MLLDLFRTAQGRRRPRRRPDRRPGVTATRRSRRTARRPSRSSLALCGSRPSASCSLAPATALAVLQQVDAKKLDPKSIPIEQLRPVLDFKNEEIDKLVLKHWGKIGQATPGEKLARIRWLQVELGSGTGDPKHGKELFTKHCAACHTLFGEGGKVGPDLTTADRKNRDYLLTHIVDPSLYVRPEFMSYNVTTLDGRRLTGLVERIDRGERHARQRDREQAGQDDGVEEGHRRDAPVGGVAHAGEAARHAAATRRSATCSRTCRRRRPAAKPLPKQDRRRSEDRHAAAKDGSPKKLKVLLISGSVEYKSDESLAAFQKHLEANYPVDCVRAFRKTDEDLPGLERLETCDVAVFYTRRLKITGEQLDRVKKYATSGKPIVAIRTASHGFQNWLDMDKEVLGGDYKGHFGHDQRPDVKLTEAGEKHPVLAGVKPFTATGGLYKNPAVAKDVTVLMTGDDPEADRSR